MLSASRIPPPHTKKTLNHSKKQNYISRKKCHLLSNTSLHYPNNLNHPKETSTPPKKLQPPPQTFILLWNDLNHLKKIFTSVKKYNLPPPPLKKISIRQKISNPSQNISTSPKCFFVYSSPVSF